MRLIDADKLKQHYAWWNNEEQRTFDQIVDAQPTVDAVPVVRCRECIHWKPPHVLQNDGTEREYNPETDIDSLGLLMVTTDVGINVGGKCYVDANVGYADDKTVFRTEDNYCGKAIRGGNIPLNGKRKDGADNG